MFHVHCTISSHVWSQKVVFLFQSIMGITVRLMQRLKFSRKDCTYDFENYVEVFYLERSIIINDAWKGWTNMCAG